MWQLFIYFFIFLSRSLLQQGEDLIRESGVPYAIVRPCALTEEPAGADLIFDQGDNITVLPSKWNFDSAVVVAQQSICC